MTSAVSGFGTQLVWNTADIAEVTSLTHNGETVNMIDVSNHDSENAYKEFIAGMVDGGDIGVEMNFKAADSVGQIALHTDIQERTMRAWQITLPSSLGNLAGNGYGTNWSMAFPPDGSITVSTTIKVTGKPTLTIS